MKKKIKEFIKTSLGRQIYSFFKTYVVVFLTLYLRDVVGEVNEGGDIILWNLAVIIPAMKWAFLSVIRNVYKILTEE